MNHNDRTDDPREYDPALAEIGSWCCGDCTAHHGQHDWNDDTTPPEEQA